MESLSSKQRDLLFLHIYVLAQHGYIKKAEALVEALVIMGEDSAAIMLARAVMRFLSNDWPAALRALDEVDRLAPIERFGAYVMTDQQRMRRYMKARCLYELNEHARAKDVVDTYIRRSIAHQHDEITGPE